MRRFAAFLLNNAKKYSVLRKNVVPLTLDFPKLLINAMRINKFSALAMALAMTLGASAQRKVAAPAPCGPLPNANQLRWHQLETYAFLHYSLNTYTITKIGRASCRERV